MQPATRSRLPLHLLEHLNQVEDIVDLANQILGCVNHLVPLQAALRVTGNSAPLANPHGFPVELLPEAAVRFEIHVPEEASRLRQLRSMGRRCMYSRLFMRDGRFFTSLVIRRAVVVVPPTVERSYPPVRCFSAGNRPTNKRSARAARRTFPSIYGHDRSFNCGRPAARDYIRLMNTIAQSRTPVTVIRGYLKMS